MNWINKIQQAIMTWMVKNPADAHLTSEEMSRLCLILEMEIDETNEYLKSDFSKSAQSYYKKELTDLTLLLAKLKKQNN